MGGRRDQTYCMKCKRIVDENHTRGILDYLTLNVHPLTEIDTRPSKER